MNPLQKVDIREHVKLGFNPATQTEDDNLRKVFEDDIARILWLAWKPGHIVNQHFAAQVLARAQRIRAMPPKTPDDLFALLYTFTGADSNFPRHDCRNFADVALPYLTGEKKITFEIVER